MKRLFLRACVSAADALLWHYGSTGKMICLEASRIGLRQRSRSHLIFLAEGTQRQSTQGPERSLGTATAKHWVVRSSIRTYVRRGLRGLRGLRARDMHLPGSLEPAIGSCVHTSQRKTHFSSSDSDELGTPHLRTARRCRYTKGRAGTYGDCHRTVPACSQGREGHVLPAPALEACAPVEEEFFFG